jgi:hypothetical protein
MQRRSARVNLSFALRSCSASSGFFFPICILLLTSSCADYESGYQHGYNNTVARKWLVIGRELYKEGYTEGQMQAFQDDWYAENADDIDVGMSCPSVVINFNPAVTASGRSLNENETVHRFY